MPSSKHSATSHTMAKSFYSLTSRSYWFVFKVYGSRVQWHKPVRPPLRRPWQETQCQLETWTVLQREQELEGEVGLGDLKVSLSSDSLWRACFQMLSHTFLQVADLCTLLALGIHCINHCPCARTSHPPMREPQGLHSRKVWFLCVTMENGVTLNRPSFWQDQNKKKRKKVFPSFLFLKL